MKGNAYPANESMLARRSNKIDVSCLYIYIVLRDNIDLRPLCTAKQQHASIRSYTYNLEQPPLLDRFHGNVRNAIHECI